ncbi:MAG: thioredoxin family protein [Deltaproteobacteria bacterium]
MKVEILGVGCAKCNKLYDLVTGIVKDRGIDADVVKIEDIKVFADYGVFMTPALVIDGVVKVAGKVPKEADVLKWMAGIRAEEVVTG